LLLLFFALKNNFHFKWKREEVKLFYQVNLDFIEAHYNNLPKINSDIKNENTLTTQSTVITSTTIPAVYSYCTSRKHLDINYETKLGKDPILQKDDSSFLPICILILLFFDIIILIDL
jgi:hypothetical protein